MLKLKYLFENYELAKEILQNWNYDEEHLDDYLQRFRISSNAIYPFPWEGKLYFLRIAPVEEKKIENLQAELKLLDYLQSSNFQVLRAIPDKKGDTLLTIDTKWGTYYASVFYRVEGKAIDDIEINSHIMEKYGSTLGQFHNLSEQFNETKERTHIDLLNQVEKWLVEFKSPSYMIEACVKVRNELDKIEIRPDNYGAIHFDFEPDNVFYDEKTDNCYVIDFEDMMYHYFSMDIEKALDAIKDEFGEQNYDEYEKAFLKGYKSKHSLTDDMIESMPIMRQYELLYKYANTTRSLAEKFENEPDWMLHIRKKIGSVNRDIEDCIKNSL